MFYSVNTPSHAVTPFSPLERAAEVPWHRAGFAQFPTCRLFGGKAGNGEAT